MLSECGIGTVKRGLSSVRFMHAVLGRLIRVSFLCRLEIYNADPTIPYSAAALICQTCSCCGIAYRGDTAQRLRMLSHTALQNALPKTFGAQQLMVNPDMSKQGCKVFIGGLVRTCFLRSLCGSSLARAVYTSCENLPGSFEHNFVNVERTGWLE